MIEEDRATLVAYLDGELDEEAARQVEARISTDPAIRAELESLERTWELLDYLPKVEPSPSFTHRTVSRITAAHQALQLTKSRRRRWLLGIAWAASLLLALFGGYEAVALMVSREPADDEEQSPGLVALLDEPTDEDLLRDVRLLKNWRQYQQVESLDFLKSLDQPDLFGDDDDPETSGDDSDQSRHIDAAESRRLKAEWKAFHKLPGGEQDRLRQLDFELNDQPPAERARLAAVLERYPSWLERLDEKDRHRIESSTKTTKVEIITELREREWLAHLPKAQRDQLDKASAKERTSLIEQWRRADRQRRSDWQLALSQQNDVAPPQVKRDFWEQVRLYETKSLSPALTFKEKKDLDRARVSWPEHARKLRELAAKYDPIKVPPGEKIGVTNFKDAGLGNPIGFPLPFLGGHGGARGHHMEGAEAIHQLTVLQGRWPEFALEVDRLAREGKIRRPNKTLGPCRPQEFVPPVQQFIADLRKDPAAARKLDEAQGKWPDYPFAVMSLAKEKNKKVPGTYLPESKEDWDQSAAQD